MPPPPNSPHWSQVISDEAPNVQMSQTLLQRRLTFLEVVRENPSGFRTRAPPEARTSSQRKKDLWTSEPKKHLKGGSRLPLSCPSRCLPPSPADFGKELRAGQPLSVQTAHALAGEGLESSCWSRWSAGGCWEAEEKVDGTQKGHIGVTVARTHLTGQRWRCTFISVLPITDLIMKSNNIATSWASCQTLRCFRCCR